MAIHISPKNICDFIILFYYFIYKIFSIMRRYGCRGNSQYLNNFYVQKHERLEQQQFESTKMKLYLLKKFERTMIAERDNQNKKILVELANQNQILQQIKEVMLSKNKEKNLLSFQLQKLNETEEQNIDQKIKIPLSRANSIMSVNSEQLDSIIEVNQQDDKLLARTKYKNKNKKINPSFSRFLMNSETQTLKNKILNLENQLKEKQKRQKEQSQKNNKLKQLQQYLHLKQKSIINKELKILRYQKGLINSKRKEEEFNNRISQLYQKTKVIEKTISQIKQKSHTAETGILQEISNKNNQIVVQIKLMQKQVHYNS